MNHPMTAADRLAAARKAGIPLEVASYFRNGDALVPVKLPGEERATNVRIPGAMIVRPDYAGELARAKELTAEAAAFDALLEAQGGNA